MSDQPSESADLAPKERALADRLESQRPVPAARFRGALRRALVAQDPGYGPRPTHLRRIASVYLAASLILLVVATLLATGTL